MQTKLQKQITNRFPQYFEGLNPRTCPFCEWGIECGDGWYALLYEMFEEFEMVTNDIRVAQIKEKFGGLTVYLDFFVFEAIETREAIHDIVSQAEEQANVTCEVCGQPGTIRTTGWWKVLCDEHNKKTGE